MAIDIKNILKKNTYRSIITVISRKTSIEFSDIYIYIYIYIYI